MTTRSSFLPDNLSEQTALVPLPGLRVGPSVEPIVEFPEKEKIVSIARDRSVPAGPRPTIVKPARAPCHRRLGAPSVKPSPPPAKPSQEKDSTPSFLIKKNDRSKSKAPQKGEDFSAKLVYELRQENLSLLRKNQRLEERLRHYEAPVKGQVPWDIYVSKQARERIRASAQQAVLRREGELKDALRAGAPNQGAAEFARRRGKKTVKPIVCHVCPKFVTLENPNEADLHYKSPSHIRWLENQVKADLHKDERKRQEEEIAREEARVRLARSSN